MTAAVQPQSQALVGKDGKDGRSAPLGYGVKMGEAEWIRLDSMHNGICDYLDGRLHPAPLENPRRILEIGAGSGAWAIQAAKQFPNAEVIATDIAPLPPRPLPANMKTQLLDVSKPLPFEPSTFDAIHLRFVLCHIPHGDTVLPRLVDLLAPGGWLLIDDCCMPTPNAATPPGIRHCIDTYNAYMRANAQDPRFGAALEARLRALPGLRAVRAARTPVRVNEPYEDPALRNLSMNFRESAERIFTGPMLPPVVEFGLTPAVQDAFRHEAATTDWRIDFEMYQTWAQKA